MDTKGLKGELNKKRIQDNHMIGTCNHPHDAMDFTFNNKRTTNHYSCILNIWRGLRKSGTNSIKHNCTYKHNGQEWEVEYTDQKEKKHSNLALVKLSNSTIHLPVKSTSFGLHEL